MKELFWTTVGLVAGFVLAVFVVPDPRKLHPKEMTVAPAVAARTAAPAPTPTPSVEAETKPCPTVVAPVIEGGAPAPQTKPLSLQQSLQRLPLADLRAECAKAEKGWLKTNLEDFAPKPKDDAEAKLFATQLFARMKETLKEGSWWRGVMDINGEHPVHIDVMLKLYGAQEAGKTDPFKSNLPTRVNSPEELCWAVSPFITSEGKIDNSPISSCRPERKKGDVFYIPYYGYNNESVAPAAQLILFPFPSKAQAMLEYFATGGGQWVQKPEFNWRASSFEEWESLHDQYVQQFEAEK